MMTSVLPPLASRQMNLRLHPSKGKPLRFEVCLTADRPSSAWTVWDRWVKRHFTQQGQHGRQSESATSSNPEQSSHTILFLECAPPFQKRKQQTWDGGETQPAPRTARHVPRGSPRNTPQPAPTDREPRSQGLGIGAPGHSGTWARLSALSFSL
ncbi:hypothetical protein B0T16DRAFT_170952 [Cercophora newfieldiana]|uniref:Uncharacterized protein n=1 Tax=Cercophora newfieldiana TaxID=92897 RepID=A0AA40CRL5_9PEZI|nr:hypothetical protein B0T16DRAFT_170952 [Cercophora newfieldiana]